jgi:chorismate mutase
LEWLAEAKAQTGLPFGVEVGNAAHVEKALGAGADFVWTGARTTVNPFVVQEIADALRGAKVVVLVKNPITPDVELWSGAVERMAKAGLPVGIVHRGFSMSGHGGYRNPPMWHVALEMRRRHPEITALCDPSHIAGQRGLVPDIAQKAADLDFHGLMLESHNDPAAALSDASQQMTPAELARMLKGIAWRSRETADVAFAEALARCRNEIDRLDNELFGLLSHRMNVSAQIGTIKRENNVAIFQEKRWSEITATFLAQAEALGLSEEFVRTILATIHAESIRRQNSPESICPMEK